MGVEMRKVSEGRIWEKRDRYIDAAFFIVLLTAVSGIMLTLFWRQTVFCWEGGGAPYQSDMKAYILEMQGLDSGYSFPYPIFFKLGALFHLAADANLSVALAAMVLNSLSIVTVKLALNRLTGERLAASFGRHRPWAGILISVASVALFFTSMVYPPEGLYLPGIKYNYLGVFTGNPFHNATYMAARPFAVLAFLWYVKLLDVYEKGWGKKGEGSEEGVRPADYTLFSFFLLLATMTKPSFTLVLVGAAGLIMAYRLVRASFRNFIPTVQLGICFIPTFLHLLYQYRGVFVPQEGQEGGIGFCLGEVWGLYCDNIPLAVGLAMGFPILMLLFHFKEEMKDTLYRFSWQFYGMGFLMNFFLYERGYRKPDFNFSWGYMYGIFFGMFGALVLLLKDTAGRRRPWLLALEWLAFLWHLTCGIYYFWKIFRGGMYY